MADDARDIRELDGALLENLGNDLWELRQDFVTEEGEDVGQVAAGMLGPKGRAVLVSFDKESQMGPYHTATYRGTMRELYALHAKFNGSEIGRPPKEMKDG